MVVIEINICDYLIEMRYQDYICSFDLPLKTDLDSVITFNNILSLFEMNNFVKKSYYQKTETKGFEKRVRSVMALETKYSAR